MLPHFLFQIHNRLIFRHYYSTMKNPKSFYKLLGFYAIYIECVI